MALHRERATSKRSISPNVQVYDESCVNQPRGERKALSGHILSSLRLALKRTIHLLAAPGEGISSRKKLIFVSAGMDPPEVST